MRRFSIEHLSGLSRIWGIWGSFYDVGQFHLLSTSADYSASARIGGVEAGSLHTMDCLQGWGPQSLVPDSSVRCVLKFLPFFDTEPNVYQ